MYEIPVFSAEREAGLANMVRKSGSIAYASQVQPSEKFDLSERSLALIRASEYGRAKAGLEDFDLYWLKDVLTTTGWNKNDDVTDPLEAWVARHTAEHKPFNEEHDSSKVIGHIVGSAVVDDEGVAVAEDSDADKLPAKFHVITTSVLYRFLTTPLQERMEQTLAEIDEGKWFVSMEVLFKGFDYAVKAADGTDRIVARNDKTAFLTKHLRAYGGTGVYENMKVGRLMRSMTFSGKGLVKKPANAESVIFTNASEFRPVTEDFSVVSAGQVYSHTSGQKETPKESAPVMATELDIQKQLADLKAENDSLKASIREDNVKQVKAQLEVVTADKAKADELLKAAQTEIAKSVEDAKAKAELATAMQAKLAEAEKALADAQAKLSGIEATQKAAARLLKVKAAFKTVEADEASVKKASAFAETLSELSDEKFDAALATVDMMTAPAPTNNPQSGNSTVPHGTAKVAPKETPAKDRPQATSLKAPMNGPMVKALSTETETADTDTKNLEGAKADVDPALSVSTPDAGVLAVQTQIATYFGCKADA